MSYASHREQITVNRLRQWQDEKGYVANDKRFCPVPASIYDQMPIHQASQAYLDSIGLSMDKYN